jgi:hypothetical protein
MGRFSRDVNIITYCLLIPITFIFTLILIAAATGSVNPDVIYIIIISCFIIVYEYWRVKYHNPRLSNYFKEQNLDKATRLLFVDIIRTSLIVAIGLTISLVTIFGTNPNPLQLLGGTLFLASLWLGLNGFFYFVEFGLL